MKKKEPKLKMIEATNGCKNCYYEHWPFKWGCTKPCHKEGKSYIYIIDKENEIN